ncbi:unnamed protein product [Heterosigma akashiwo]
MRKLNEATLPCDFPIPTIQSLLDHLSGASIFSTIDLKSGFYQVEIEYLGHIVDSDGVRPDDTKIQIIKNAKSPDNVTKQRLFWLWSDFYRSFIPRL